MGATNSTAANSSARLPAGVNNLVGELGNDVYYEQGMGSSRFLKAIKARHRHGPLVVKTFVKPAAYFSLRILARRLRVEREALADVPNALTYQKVVETDTAGYLIRQWMSTNLYDRISTRPFLTTIEKKWITFQLLQAMADARSRGVPHGDLKTENVLVTSSLFVYVTDFASSFKQVYLPLNDPSDFNFYFGTSGRRTCYLAPERFYEPDSDIAKQKAKTRTEASSIIAPGGATNIVADAGTEKLAELFKRDGKVTEAMDVFSLGCVIAELWRDGAPFFTLMQLFKYRDGQYDVRPALAEIPDPHIRSMVKSMTSPRAKSRKSFETYLAEARRVCFPDVFYTFLHRYLTTLQRTSPVAAASMSSSDAASSSAARTAIAQARGGQVSAVASEAGQSTTAGEGASIFRAESDERMERMYEEWSVVSRILDGDEHVLELASNDEDGSITESNTEAQFEDLQQHGQDKPTSAYSPGLCIPGISSESLLHRRSSPTEDGPALLVLSPILANMRNTLRPSSKIHCFELLLHLSARWLSDEAKLDRVLPYLISMINDESVMVRAEAIKSTLQLLALVDSITPSNVSTFVDYILPNLRTVTRDSSSLVRATYAARLKDVATIGMRHIQMGSAMRAEGVFAADLDGRENGSAADFLNDQGRPEDEAGYDQQVETLRTALQEEAVLLLSDASPVVKRSIISNIEPLCLFFGSALTNDVILSHIITFLNDRSWMLRQAFFDALPAVSKVAGARSVEDYILTLLLQALSDPEEFVVLHVLFCLARMISESPRDRRIVSDSKILDVLGATAGFLCHPNRWLVVASSIVMTAGAKQLGETEVWAFLYPSIRPLLRCDIGQIRPFPLTFAAKEPLSREVLSKSVQWASRAKASSFWKPQHGDTRSKAGLANGLGKEGVALFAHPGERGAVKTPIQRSEEDDAYFDSLRSSGFDEKDEVKLVALRDYIAKLARTSNLVGPANSTNLLHQEDAGLLAPLPIKSALAAQPLSGLTPLTIFFGTKNKSATDTGRQTNEGEAATTVSGKTQTYDGSFTSRIARKRIGNTRIFSDTSSLNPLDELRKRMAYASISESADPKRRADEIEAESPISAAKDHEDVPAQPALASKLDIGKAQAATASTSANVSGTMAERRGAAKGERKGAPGPAVNGVPPPGSAKDGEKDQEDEAGAEATFVSTYEGHDPYIKAHLEAVWITTFQDRNPGWGPAVSSSSRRSAPAKSTRGIAAPSGAANSNRRPEGNLVAYFTEHTASITSIAVSPDHAFFVSGSADGTVKVWDTARLEKNVTSRSRSTYTGQKGSITSIVMLDSSHCVASAATDGSVHVVRIEVSTPSSSYSSLPRYGKVRLVSNFQLSNPREYVVTMVQGSRKSGTSTHDATFAAGGAASMSFSTANGPPATSSTGSTLLLATSKNRIVVLDLRTMQVLSTFQNPGHLGSITALCTDARNMWLLVGTSHGALCLWDLRFQLLVKSWRIIDKGSGGNARINSLAIHPSRGGGRWVLAAYETMNLTFAGQHRLGAGKTQVLVETWDIDREVCVESYETARGGTTPGAGKEISAVAPCKSGSSWNEGVSSPASAIQQLVSAHEAHLQGQGEEATETAADDDNEESKLRRYANREVIPPPPPSSAVRAVVVQLGGYTSSSLPNTAQVSGGWVDAGKLAASTTMQGGKDISMDSSGGPAGYLLTGGMDQRIRFWDLGRSEKSTSFGATTDEKSEFRTRLGGGDASSSGDSDPHDPIHAPMARNPSSDGRQDGGKRRNSPSHQPTRFTHITLPSPGAARAAASALRSPLLTQHASNASTNVLMRAHKDAVTALAILESPFRCIVAGDYAGNIRVWE